MPQVGQELGANHKRSSFMYAGRGGEQSVVIEVWLLVTYNYLCMRGRGGLTDFNYI